MNDIFRTCHVRQIHSASLSHYNLTSTMHLLSVRWDVKNVKRCLQSLTDNYTIMAASDSVMCECMCQDVIQDDLKIIGFFSRLPVFGKLGNDLPQASNIFHFKQWIYSKSGLCGLLTQPAITEHSVTSNISVREHFISLGNGAGTTVMICVTLPPLKWSY